MTTGVGIDVVVAVVPYSVDEDRVEELHPTSARPASDEMKIIFFIGELSCRATDPQPPVRFAADAVSPSMRRIW